MALFPIIEVEATLQEGDKTRLDATKSYDSSGTALTKIEIKPSASDSYIDVTTTGYLDWQYSKATSADTESFTVTVKLNDNVSAVASNIITVIEATADKLFATDEDLLTHEESIHRFLKDGKATFKNFHRRAQKLIFDWLSQQSYVDDFGNRISKDNITATTIVELNAWATFLALKLIYQGVYNAKDDVFLQKARHYASLELQARDNAMLRLDLNKDGSNTQGEGLDVRTCVVLRR